MMSLSHWAWVDEAASLHLNKTARLASREAKDSVRLWPGVRSPSSFPVVPTRATRGSGSMSNLKIEDKVWKTSLQYFSRLGHVQNIWIREASSLEHLSQQGFTSGRMCECLTLDQWALCTTFNCSKQCDDVLTKMKIEFQTPSTVECSNPPPRRF